MNKHLNYFYSLKNELFSLKHYFKIGRLTFGSSEEAKGSQEYEVVVVEEEMNELAL